MKGSHEIRWKRSALKELKKLPTTDRKRVLQAVQHLADTPLPQGTRKLAGSERTFRIRVGSYRVIYGLVSEEVLIEIIRVRHRKDSYR